MGDPERSSIYMQCVAAEKGALSLHWILSTAEYVSGRIVLPVGSQLKNSGTLSGTSNSVLVGTLLSAHDGQQRHGSHGAALRESKSLNSNQSDSVVGGP
jgi:hypothetical protein